MKTATAAADTKQKLIDTALELLWKNSYGRVSVDDICKASELKKGSFYHYFPSKLDLTIAAMDEDAKKSMATYDSIFSPRVPPLQRFETVAEEVYAIQKEAAEKYGHVCGCPCASIASEMAGQSEPLHRKLEEIATTRKRYFENGVRDLIVEGYLPADTDAKTKAQEVYNFLSGEIMLARIHNDLKLLKDGLKEGLMRTLGIKDGVKQHP